MSRYAATSRDSLMRAYVLSLRLLLIVALPIAAGMPFIAEGLILVLGGAEYLPHSRIALQLIIWFLPFSFVNSVTQYVLIAIDQQRFLTKAFLIGVTFNVVANLVFIPFFSYQGAAVVTILSEWALLIPFYYAVRKHLGPLPWISLAWQPTAASAVMAGAMWLLRDLHWLLLIPVGGVVYLAVLVLVGGAIALGSWFVAGDGGEGSGREAGPLVLASIPVSTFEAWEEEAELPAFLGGYRPVSEGKVRWIDSEYAGQLMPWFCSLCSTNCIEPINMFITSRSALAPLFLILTICRSP